jgi:hypothetical protein
MSLHHSSAHLESDLRVANATNSQLASLQLLLLKNAYSEIPCALCLATVCIGCRAANRKRGWSESHQGMSQVIDKDDNGKPIHPLLQFYKPFGLNFYTTIFFLAPTFYGLVESCPQVSIGSFACFVAGLLNHATYQKHIAIVDRVVVAFCVVYFSVRCATWTWYYLGMVLAVVILVVGYNFFSFTANGVLYHSFLHLASNIGICLMIKGCAQASCPLYVGDQPFHNPFQTPH